MKSLIKRITQAVSVVSVLALGVAFVAPLAVSAQCDDIKSGIAGGSQCAKPDTAPEKLFGDNSVFVTITNIMLFLIGAIAVVMLIIGGVRYAISAGDTTAVTAAKNTILYAIVGIVVAFLAYAVVAFVSDQLEKGTSSTYSKSA